jgi:hypothetical protein
MTNGPFQHAANLAEKITLTGENAVKINGRFDVLFDALDDIARCNITPEETTERARTALGWGRAQIWAAEAAEKISDEEERDEEIDNGQFGVGA